MKLADWQMDKTISSCVSFLYFIYIPRHKLDRPILQLCPSLIKWWTWERNYRAYQTFLRTQMSFLVNVILCSVIKDLYGPYWSSAMTPDLHIRWNWLARQATEASSCPSATVGHMLSVKFWRSLNYRFLFFFCLCYWTFWPVSHQNESATMDFRDSC
jgi:hypothetical protein